MRKTLLIAAAALAASVISSEAQVYSQNIVGYVNQTFVAGYVNVANPLDNAAGNSITNVIPNNGALDGVLVYLWSGTAYTIRQLDSSSPTGVSDLGNAPVPAPVLNPGVMLFVNNNSGVKFTNTYVGNVHVDGVATGSQTVGTTTNALGLGYNFVASKLPIASKLSTDLQLVNNGGALDGVLVYTPNITAAGAFLGYVIVQYDSSSGTGFSDLGNAPAPEPAAAVGSGFIINNNTGVPFKWVQAL